MAQRVTFPKSTVHPRSMPELRAALIDKAVPNGVWAKAEFQKLLVELAGPGARKEASGDGTYTITGPNGYGPEEMPGLITNAQSHAENNIRWYRETLPLAQLIHVNEQMTDFVTAAAEAVPHDIKLQLHDAPSPAGLVVFAKPMFGTDSGPDNPGMPVRLDGIIWGPVSLPARDIPWYQDSEARVFGTSIASLRMIDPDEDGDELDELLGVGAPRLQSVTWVPLGRSDWPWGDALDHELENLPNKSDAQWVSILEDRRLLAALWATINQKRLVDTEIILPDRHIRKRLVRAGHGDTQRDERVNVIHLRRNEYRMLDQTEESGRHLTKRFIVRPHYRRQPYGPGRKLRKIIIVPAHWKGPDDAPISRAENVWAVDR